MYSNKLGLWETREEYRNRVFCKLLSEHFDKMYMAWGQGQWPRLTGNNGFRKVAFLLKKCVRQGSEQVLAKKSEEGCTQIVKGTQKDMVSRRGVWGPPLENFWISGLQMELFWVNLPQYPYPYPLKKILFRFTLILRMVLGVGKKSEIRLKSEDSVPCKGGPSHKLCPIS